MKLGLISDIHAEYKRLMAALDLLERLDVDQIVCGGDLVEKGEEGEKTVRAIRDLGIATVRGNHDEMAAGNQGWIRQNLDPKSPFYTQYLLSEESVKFLSELPIGLKFGYQGLTLLLTHGAPWSNMSYVYPSSPRVVMEQVWEKAAAEIVLLGHTHKPMVIRHAARMIVNPGSVCGDLAGSATCAVLTLPDPEVTFYRIDSGLEYADAARVSLPEK